MKLAEKRIRESIEVKNKILSDQEILHEIHKIGEEIINCFRSGNKVLFAGNGGSAADAQHLAAEFSGRYYIDRPALPSEALHVNTSYITAVGNDYSYDVIYSRYLVGAGKVGDVLVCLSTSGNSVNLVNAAIQARELGMKVVSFTGETGGKLKEYSDYLLNVPSKDTPRIQESHITMGHVVCEIVENELFRK